MPTRIGPGSIRPDSWQRPLKFWEITPDQWRRFVAVHTTAPLALANAVVPEMMRKGWGRIVNVTTSLGTMINPGFPTYGPSKAALEALSAIMAKDLDGTGVTVNVLVPGGITNTPMVSESGFDLAKMIQPEVMAPPVLWLVSDDAGKVTGRRFLGVPLGSHATARASGREGRGTGGMDEHCDDANHAEPVVARAVHPIHLGARSRKYRGHGEQSAKRLPKRPLLRELFPGLHRLAVIVRHDPGLDQKLQDIRSEAQRKGIEALMLEATTGKALELAFTRLRSERCEAIYVASGPLGPAKRARIIALAAEARLPAMYSFRIFPAEGGLMSFAADYGDLFRRAAGFVDRILKGAKPGAVPVEPPGKFDLTVNLDTAKTLGLTIPPTILTSADEVIGSNN